MSTNNTPAIITTRDAFNRGWAASRNTRTFDLDRAEQRHQARHGHDTVDAFAAGWVAYATGEHESRGAAWNEYANEPGDVYAERGYVAPVAVAVPSGVDSEGRTVDQWGYHIPDDSTPTPTPVQGNPLISATVAAMIGWVMLLVDNGARYTRGNRAIEMRGVRDHGVCDYAILFDTSGSADTCLDSVTDNTGDIYATVVGWMNTAPGVGDVVKAYDRKLAEQLAAAAASPVTDCTRLMSWEYELLGYPSCNRALVYPVTLDQQARALTTPQLWVELFRADEHGDTAFYRVLSDEIDYRENFNTRTVKTTPLATRKDARNRARVRNLSRDALLTLVNRYRSVVTHDSAAISALVDPLQAELDTRNRYRRAYRAAKSVYWQNLDNAAREYAYDTHMRNASDAMLNTIVSMDVNGTRTRAAEREIHARNTRNNTAR